MRDAFNSYVLTNLYIARISSEVLDSEVQFCPFVPFSLFSKLILSTEYITVAADQYIEGNTCHSPPACPYKSCCDPPPEPFVAIRQLGYRK